MHSQGPLGGSPTGAWSDAPAFFDTPERYPSNLGHSRRARDSQSRDALSAKTENDTRGDPGPDSGHPSLSRRPGRQPAASRGAARSALPGQGGRDHSRPVEGSRGPLHPRGRGHAGIHWPAGGDRRRIPARFLAPRLHPPVRGGGATARSRHDLPGRGRTAHGGHRRQGPVLAADHGRALQLFEVGRRRRSRNSAFPGRPRCIFAGAETRFRAGPTPSSPNSGPTPPRRIARRSRTSRRPAAPTCSSMT